jgi:hypothetical protein
MLLVTQIDTVVATPTAVQINTLPSGSLFSQFNATRFGLSREARNLLLDRTSLTMSIYQILQCLRPQRFSVN